MQTMRGYVAAALAALAVLAAGCGGGSSSSSGDSLSTASLAPKDAGAWVSIDTDPDSAQWQSLETLLKKIPGAEQALDDPNSSPFSGASLRADVLPAIGPRLVLVLPAASSNPIMLVQPSDTDKLDALLAKTEEHEVTGDVDGWTAIATSQKELDAYQAALDGGTLEGSDSFASGTKGLPEDALATGYVNGKGLASGLGDLGGLGSVAGLSALPGLASGASGTGSAFRTTSSSGSSPPALPASAADVLRSAGFAVTVSDDTIHFEASLEVPGGQTPPAYGPTLLGKVPSDALVAVSFQGGASLSKQLASSGGAAALKQLEQQLGVSFDELAQALEGEGVLYVRPGAPIPEITLAVTSDDPAAAKQVFDKVVAKLGGAASQGFSIPGFELTTAVSGDTVIVSTSKSTASSFGSGPSLTDTERFKAAAAAVGLGETTSGFAYVDVHGLAPLVQTVLGALGGSGSSSGSDDLLKALGSLDFVAVNAVGENSRVRIEGALKTS